LGGGYNQRNATLRKEFVVPRKIRELVADLETAGFEDRGGKGSHRNFVHPNVARPVTISGNAGDDAKKYQERAVRKAIEESKS
jgi:predicted RNA binding protein YcfA (HicA-like mRNA interferase family)